jgi:hypothetical protein
MSPLAARFSHLPGGAGKPDPRWCPAANTARPLHRCPTPASDGCTTQSIETSGFVGENSCGYRSVTARGATRRTRSASIRNDANIGIATTAAVGSTCRSMATLSPVSAHRRRARPQDNFKVRLAPLELEPGGLRWTSPALADGGNAVSSLVLYDRRRYHQGSGRRKGFQYF